MNNLKSICICFLLLMISGIIINIYFPQQHSSKELFYQKDSSYNIPFQPDDHLDYMKSPHDYIYDKPNSNDADNALLNVINSRDKMYIPSNRVFDPVDKINKHRLGKDLPVGKSIKCVYDEMTKGVDINTKEPINLPNIKKTNIGDIEMVNLELSPYQMKYNNEKPMNGGKLIQSDLYGNDGNNAEYMSYETLMEI